MRPTAPSEASSAARRLLLLSYPTRIGLVDRPRTARLASLLIDASLVLVLALSPLVSFWRLFAGEPALQTTIADGDFTEEYFPVLLTAARILSSGEWPLWNPYSNAGQPLLADPQTALFYPPTWWALSGIDGPNGPSLVALERLVPLHLSLAAVSMYLLGRVLLGSRLAAVVAAIVFVHSGFLTSYPVEQLPILRAAAWFPLQLAGLWLALQYSLFPWAILSGLALGMSVLAGHPQTTFLEGVGLVVMTAAWQCTGGTYRAGSQSGDRDLRTPSGAPALRIRLAGPQRAIAALGLSAAVALGLGAVQLVPTYEFLGVSNRSQVDFRFLSGGFTLWELPMDLWAPRVLGGRPPYVGLVALVLAAVAVAMKPRPVHWVAFALAITGLCLSTGANTFVYAALYNLAPGFDLFRGQERSIMLFALGIALLAGAGASTLAGPLSRRDLRRLVSIQRGASLLLVGGAALAFGMYWRAHVEPVTVEMSARWAEVIRSTAFATAMLAVALGILSLRTLVPALRPALPLLVVAFSAVDLLAVGWQAHVQPRSPESVYPRPSPLIERALAELGPGRVYDDWVLRGNHGLVHGLPSATRTFPIHLERFTHATDYLPLERLLDLLNVRYVSTWEAPGPGREALAQESPRAQRFLYGRSALGPAWIVPGAVPAASPDEALDAVARRDFDARSTVVVEGMASPLPSGGGFGRVTAYQREWSRVEALAVAPQGGFLVLSEMAYPSWRARLNGVEVPLVTANYLLQAIWLPPGTHRVELVFDGTPVVIGMGITLVTLLAVAVYLVVAGLLFWARRSWASSTRSAIPIPLPAGRGASPASGSSETGLPAPVGDG